MVSRLSEAGIHRQARELRELFAEDDRAAAVALFEFVRLLGNDARRIRRRASEDAYVQRSLASWDRDMARVRAQLLTVMRPALDGSEDADVRTDVIAPVLDGLWPSWLFDLPMYASGSVRPMDPLLPPTARVETVDGEQRFKTRPVTAAVVALWNSASEAVEFDAANRGDDAPSRSIKSFLTEMERTFEEKLPEDAPTAWQGVVDWSGRLAEAAADKAGELWDEATDGFAYVAGVAAGVVLVAWGVGRWMK